jgi:hypothetical protein
MPYRLARLDRRIAEAKRSIAEQVAELRRQVGSQRPPSLQQAIATFARARGITTLYHFTPVENLPSICEHGLLSRLQALALNDPRTVFPDERRNDQAPWAVCCSISWPNHSMRYIKERDRGLTFAVIALDACLLWEKDCIYLPGNASRADLASSIRAMRHARAYRLAQLKALFPEPDPRRIEWRAYPTDAQAEVLVSDPPIELSYFRAIYFNSVPAMRYAQKLPWPTLVDCHYNGGVFKVRPDRRVQGGMPLGGIFDFLR